MSYSGLDRKVLGHLCISPAIGDKHKRLPAILPWLHVCIYPSPWWEAHLRHTQPPAPAAAHLWGLGNHLILPHSGAALVCSRPGMSSATTHVLALSIYSTHTSMNTISPPGPLITAKAVEHIHRYYIRSVRIC